MASEAVSIRDAKKIRPYIAEVTPMSRTRPARASKLRDSSSPRPNSLTSTAPETLNRSVMVVFISAFSPYASSVIDDSLRPISRAGTMNTGSRMSESRVIFQDNRNIALNTMTTVTRLLTTLASVSVNACWAPSTSLFSRLTSAPVWVRVKNAIGIFWM